MRKLSQYKRLTEEDTIGFEQYSYLSYHDPKDAWVDLYIKNIPVGRMKVWKDSEENGREYLTINNEIVYLDTITQRI